MVTKDDVREFWERAACGEDLLLESMDLRGFAEQARRRYELEPFIAPFAQFGACRGQRVLEIGLGLGADHQQFAQAGAQLWGVDLTQRAVSITGRRLALLGLTSELAVGDAENLPFDDGFFDLVYSWGVIHHSPDTPRAISEIFRVLKPGGRCRVMIYNKRSLVGLMLWVRYGLGRLHPLTTLEEIYARYLESPGTKAYTEAEAAAMFAMFDQVKTKVVLTHGDLLSSGAGQRHGGLVLDLARVLWPRRILARVAKNNGLFLLVEAVKAED